MSAPLPSTRRPSAPSTPTSPSGSTTSPALYQDTGRYAEAEPLFQRAIAIIEKALPPNHPNLRTARYNYAGLLDQLGRTNEAAVLRSRADAASR